MDEKINLQEINSYGAAYSEKLLDAFFSAKDRITGKEILSLSETRQVNLFVLFEIFRSWREESAKVRSPFFDYDAVEVQEAMGNLMNTLSNHISVSRQDFEPLLKRSTVQTLLLIVGPYDFFADFIERQEEPIAVETIRTQLKYLKINRAPLERLFQKLEGQNRVTVSSNEAFALLDTILEEVSFSPEDVEGYLAQFSRVVPVSLSNFYLTTAATDTAVPDSAPAPVPDPPVPSGAPFSATLNDRHANPSRSTLADNFKHITNIKDHLTINQKFMFTKVLFHGDFELFTKAVDDLDRQDNLAGAMRYLQMNHAEWDPESEEYHEFMELIEKRFRE